VSRIKVARTPREPSELIDEEQLFRVDTTCITLRLDYVYDDWAECSQTVFAFIETAGIKQKEKSTDE
jgi:hypothetical protein